MSLKKLMQNAALIAFGAAVGGYAVYRPMQNAADQAAKARDITTDADLKKVQQQKSDLKTLRAANANWRKTHTEDRETINRQGGIIEAQDTCLSGYFFLMVHLNRNPALAENAKATCNLNNPQSPFDSNLYR
jgi:hypothetical protein